jgi:hypothetical protein
MADRRQADGSHGDLHPPFVFVPFVFVPAGASAAEAEAALGRFVEPVALPATLEPDGQGDPESDSPEFGSTR